MSELRDYLEAHPELEDLSLAEFEAHMQAVSEASDYQATQEV